MVVSEEYHLPNRRLARKRKQTESFHRQTRSALWQIISVAAIASVVATTCVYIGSKYNFYELISVARLFWDSADSDIMSDRSLNAIFRHNLTFEKFEHVFLNRRVVSFASPLNDSMRDEIWRLLQEQYAELSVPVGHAASQTLGEQSPLYHIKLTDYFRHHTFTPDKPHYIFDNQLLNKLPGIREIIDDHPHVLLSEHGRVEPVFHEFDASPIFTMGVNGSGLAFHQHRRSWNDLYVGKKLWSIYPPFNLPQRGFNPWEPHITWLQREEPKLKGQSKPLTFIQHPGEVVYIPEGWYHATMSIGPTVSAARQPIEPLPGTPYYYIVKGEIELAKQNYESASHLFEEGLELSNDKDFNLMRKVGEAAEKLGQTTKAELQYRRAIALNNLHPAAYVELVGLLHEGNNSAAALEVLKVAEKREVSHPALQQYREQVIAAVATEISIEEEGVHNKDTRSLESIKRGERDGYISAIDDQICNTKEECVVKDDENSKVKTVTINKKGGGEQVTESALRPQQNGNNDEL